MELKQIKELMAVMQRTGTKRLKIKREDVELELEREDNGPQALQVPVQSIEDHPLRQELALQRANFLLSRGAEFTTALPQAHPMVTAPPLQQLPQESEAVAGHYVKAPMVGTLYTSPSPADAAFVKVGDKVEKETVVCIIEAMKVMNEVKAGYAGTIAEIYVQTGHPVEFGTKLLKIT